MANSEKAKYLWQAACSGKIEKLKDYYENGGEKNIRFSCFGLEHSLIAGAYRNNQSNVVDYLFSIGETILPEERDEIKRTIMLWKDDFIREKDWETICQILNVGLDTQTLELKVNVIAALPYKK